MKKPFIQSKIRAWLPWLCLGLGFAVTITFYALYGERLMDSDQASELILANLLNRDGGILSGSWYYSTELRVLNSQLVYRLGLMLFADWHTATTFSLTVMLLILVGSYLFLSKTAYSVRTGIWTAVFLTLPFSRQHTDYFLFGGYYIPHLAISFVSVGLMLHLSTQWRLLPPWRRIAETVFLTALCAGAGLGGVRELVICYVPMLVTAVGLLLARAFNHKNGWGARPLAAILSLLSMFAGMAGYRLNSYLLTHGFNAASYSGAELQSLTFQGIRHMLAQAAWAIGWNGFPGKTPIQTVQSLLTIVLTLLIAIALIRGFRRWRELNDAQQFLLMFFPVNCTLVLLACVLTGNGEARFLLPSALYFLFVLQIGLEGMVPQWRKWMCAALAVCIVTESTCVLLRMDVREESPIDEVAAWLVDHGYTDGFATFWNSNIVTALSDGKIEMWTVVPPWMPQWSDLTLYPWLQEKDHLVHLPEGKIFLLLTSYEDAADLPFSQAAHEVYCHDGYTVYEYESAEMLYGTLGITP